eukprot:350953-Chlamydomonas_euryale.AAC.1
MLWSVEHIKCGSFPEVHVAITATLFKTTGAVLRPRHPTTAATLAPHSQYGRNERPPAARLPRPAIFGHGRVTKLHLDVFQVVLVACLRVDDVQVEEGLGRCGMVWRSGCGKAVGWARHRSGGGKLSGSRWVGLVQCWGREVVGKPLGGIGTVLGEGSCREAVRWDWYSVWGGKLSGSGWVSSVQAGRRRKAVPFPHQVPTCSGH